MDETDTSQGFIYGFTTEACGTVERGDLQTPWMFFHRFIQEEAPWNRTNSVLWEFENTAKTQLNHQSPDILVDTFNTF